MIATQKKKVPKAIARSQPKIVMPSGPSSIAVGHRQVDAQSRDARRRSSPKARESSSPNGQMPSAQSNPPASTVPSPKEAVPADSPSGPQASTALQSTSEVPADPEISLIALAKDAVKSCDDIDGAVKQVRRKLTESPDVLAALTEQMLMGAIRHAVHDARHQNMRNVKAFASAPRGLESIRFASGVLAMSMLDSWMMPDGGVLGDTLGESLKPLAEQERMTGEGHLGNSRFYLALDGKVPKQKRVRDSITDQQAIDIYKSAVGHLHRDTHGRTDRRRRTNRAVPETTETRSRDVRTNGKGRNGQRGSDTHATAAVASDSAAVAAAV